MAEEYREYRRSRKSSRKKEGHSVRFSKKLGYQTLISLILLIAVFALRTENASSPANKYIENALLYKPDTSGITEVIGRIFKSIENEGTQYDENSASKNF